MSEVFLFKSEFLVQFPRLKEDEIQRLVAYFSEVYPQFLDEKVLVYDEYLYSKNKELIQLLKKRFLFAKSVYLEERSKVIKSSNSSSLDEPRLRHLFGIFNTDPKFYRMSQGAQNRYGVAYSQYPKISIYLDNYFKVEYSNARDASHARILNRHSIRLHDEIKVLK